MKPVTMDVTFNKVAPTRSTRIRPPQALAHIPSSNARFLHTAVIPTIGDQRRQFRPTRRPPRCTRTDRAGLEASGVLRPPQRLMRPDLLRACPRKKIMTLGLNSICRKRGTAGGIPYGESPDGFISPHLFIACGFPLYGTPAPRRPTALVGTQHRQKRLPGAAATEFIGEHRP